MNRPITDIRVGIPMIGTKSWLGGVAYVELLLRAVRSLPKHEQPKIILVITQDLLRDPSSFDLYKDIVPLSDGLVVFSKDYPGQTPAPSPDVPLARSFGELFQHVDCYYPATCYGVYEYPIVSWIQDFQHVHLPQFFSADERRFRDSLFSQTAQTARVLVMSSYDAAKDFKNLYPRSQAEIKIFHFHARPLEEWYQGDPAAVAAKYKLPERFIICCNQFWMHKDHVTVFRAVAELRKQGIEVPVVCTGAADDHRNPQFFRDLSAQIDALGIRDLVTFVGTVPRHDQIQLIRRSVVLVQPSLFEGWSTVVEDGRALGKTMVISDLEVNIEQSPKFSSYFKRSNPADLATKLADVWKLGTPGPDRARENEARADVDALSTEYAYCFLDIVKTILGNFGVTVNVPAAAKALGAVHTPAVDQPSTPVQPVLSQPTSPAPFMTRIVESRHELPQPVGFPTPLRTSKSRSSKRKLKLYTTFYIDSLPERHRENQICLENNLKNDHFDEVVVFVEDLALAEPLLNHPKVKLVLTPEPRVKYQDFVKHANSEAEPSIVAFSNTDIYYDETVARLHELAGPNKFLVGTRKDVKKDGGASFTEWIQSCDTWVFETPIKDFWCDIRLGVIHCESLFLGHAQRAGYELENISLLVNTYHYHVTNKRNYHSEVKRYLDFEMMAYPELGQSRRSVLPQKPIVIDGAVFSNPKAGEQVWAWTTALKEMAQHPISRHIAILDRSGTAPRIDGLTYIDAPGFYTFQPNTDSRVVENFCRAIGAKVFVSTWYTKPFSIPTICAVTDMMPFALNADLDREDFRYRQPTIAHASAFIVPRKAVKAELLQHFPHISPDSVLQARFGGPIEKADVDQKRIDAFKAASSLGKPYVLWIGERLGYLGHRKADAFLKAFMQSPLRDTHAAVFLAETQQFEVELGKLAQGGDIRLVVGEYDIWGAIAGAAALAYPATYLTNSAGLDLALALGTPIVGGDIPSIREATGEAAELVNPYDIRSITDGLMRATNTAKRATYAARGYAAIKREEHGLGETLIRLLENFLHEQTSESSSTVEM